MLTHWSVAKAGSNDETNWRSKISLDCPFKLNEFEKWVWKMCLKNEFDKFSVIFVIKVFFCFIFSVYLQSLNFVNAVR